MRALRLAGGLEARRPYWDALWVGDRPLDIHWNDPLTATLGADAAAAETAADAPPADGP